MKRKLIELLTAGKHDTLTENIIVCAAAALAGTFYAHEYYYEQQFGLHTEICLILTAIIAVIWPVCAFHSGTKGKAGFAVFTLVYWGMPFAYTLYYASRDNLHDYSKWLAMINRAAGAMLKDPFRAASDKLSASPETLAAVLTALTALAYLAGTAVCIYRRKQHGDVGISDDKNELSINPKEGQ
jgi:uncharacterized membrane protein (DUF4010 family)